MFGEVEVTTVVKLIQVQDSYINIHNAYKQFPFQTHCQANLYGMGRNADLFKDPLQFIPERWLRDHYEGPAKALTNLPFGHGPRMCIGWYLSLSVSGMMHQQLQAFIFSQAAELMFEDWMASPLPPYLGREWRIG